MECLATDGRVISRHLPQGPGNGTEKWAERSQEAEVRENMGKAVSSGNDRSLQSRMNAQQLWQHAQALYKPKIDQITAWRRKTGRKSHPS